jgi:hypothetical protein
MVRLQIFWCEVRRRVYSNSIDASASSTTGAESGVSLHSGVSVDSQIREFELKRKMRVCLCKQGRGMK